MAVEMAIWRMSDDGPNQLVSSPLDSEQRLEDMLAEDPTMTGPTCSSSGGRYRPGSEDSSISSRSMPRDAPTSSNSSVTGPLGTSSPRRSTTGPG